MHNASKFEMNKCIKFSIRTATTKDLNEIQFIYNHFISNTCSTMDIYPKTNEEMLLWYHQHNDQYPIIVGEIEGKILGVAYLSKWSQRLGYSITTEASIYLHPNQIKQGYGLKLLDWLIIHAKKSYFVTMLSFITSGNHSAQALLLKKNFCQRGCLVQAGFKFGKFWDIDIYNLNLLNNNSAN